uniref:Uncharacterized protein n=1 Tax=Amazona collaria TaxID=241587 RepID=A0A8B9FGU1_9PSIT
LLLPGRSLSAGRKGRKPEPGGRHDRPELERLAGLLPFPEEVVAGLEKLSVLRLSSGYLRAERFFSGEAHRRRDITLERRWMSFKVHSNPKHAVQRGLASLDTEAGWHLGAFCLLLGCALEIHEEGAEKLKPELLTVRQQQWLLLQS